MALCGNQDLSFTDADLTANFSSSGVVPLLPAGGLVGASRTSDQYNLLTQDAIKGRINSLLAGNGSTPPKVPSMPEYSLSGSNNDSTAFDAYIDNLNALKNEITDEYCFYNSRYRYAVKTLISMIADATSGNATNGNAIAQYTKYAIDLNQKLTDITQIVNGLTETLYVNAQGMESIVNNLNADIKSYFQRLREQQNILKSEAPAAELKKRMVEFTREKSLVSNNMLSFYFFMDVVALGILFYVYRAS